MRLILARDQAQAQKSSEFGCHPVDNGERAGAQMVVDPAGSEPEARDLSLPALRAPPAVPQ
jgi:hypothetical protein